MVTLTSADRRHRRPAHRRRPLHRLPPRQPWPTRADACGSSAATHATYVRQVVRAIEQAVEGDDRRQARVMLVGSVAGRRGGRRDRGGRHLRARSWSTRSSRPAPRRPRCRRSRRRRRVLSLEDRADPVALLGSLINANVTNRVTVVFDGAGSGHGASTSPAAERPTRPQHPGLRAEIKRIQELGYLAGLSRRRSQMSCTNSSSWVRLRHSTIGTISPYAGAALSPVPQCRGCSGLSHQAWRTAPLELAQHAAARGRCSWSGRRRGSAATSSGPARRRAPRRTW